MSAMPAASEPVPEIHADDGEGAWFHDDRKAIADGPVIVSATGLKPPLATLGAVTVHIPLRQAFPGA